MNSKWQEVQFMNICEKVNKPRLEEIKSVVVRKASS